MSVPGPERIKEIVCSNFDDSVDKYENFEGRFGLFQRLASDLARICGISAGMKVVDVGCGTGVSTFVLKDFVGNGGRVTGIDLSERMLDAARKKHIERQWGGGKGAPISFLRGDAERLQDVIADSMDAVLYNATIFLLPDATRSLNEAYEILVSGGVVGMSFILGVFPREVNGNEGSPSGAMNFHNDDDLFRAARENGLESAPYGRGIADVRSLPASLTDAGFSGIQHGVLDMVMTSDVFRAFYRIPAQSAGLYPKTSYEERLVLLDALLDYFGDNGITHFTQRWGWCSAVK